MSFTMVIPAGAMRGSFLAPHHEELLKFLDVKVRHTHPSSPPRNHHLTLLSLWVYCNALYKWNHAVFVGRFQEGISHVTWTVLEYFEGDR